MLVKVLDTDVVDQREKGPITFSPRLLLTVTCLQVIKIEINIKKMNKKKKKSDYRLFSNFNTALLLLFLLLFLLGGVCAGLVVFVVLVVAATLRLLLQIVARLGSFLIDRLD